MAIIPGGLGGTSRGQFIQQRNQGIGQGLARGFNTGLQLQEQKRQFDTANQLELLGQVIRNSKTQSIQEAFEGNPELGKTLLGNLGYGRRNVDRIYDSIVRGEMGITEKLKGDLADAYGYIGDTELQQILDQQEEMQTVIGDRREEQEQRTETVQRDLVPLPEIGEEETVPQPDMGDVDAVSGAAPDVDVPNNYWEFYQDYRDTPEQYRVQSLVELAQKHNIPPEHTAFAAEGDWEGLGFTSAGEDVTQQGEGTESELFQNENQGFMNLFSRMDTDARDLFDARDIQTWGAVNEAMSRALGTEVNKDTVGTIEYEEEEDGSVVQRWDPPEDEEAANEIAQELGFEDWRGLAATRQELINNLNSVRDATDERPAYEVGRAGAFIGEGTVEVPVGAQEDLRRMAPDVNQDAIDRVSQELGEATARLQQRQDSLAAPTEARINQIRPEDVREVGEAATQMASMVSDSVGAAAKQRIDQFMRDPNMLGAFSVAFQNSQAAQMALGRMEVEEAERKLELFRESGLLDAEMEARMAEAAADMAQAQTDLTKAKLGMAEAMVGAATLGSAPEQLQETFQTVTSRLNTLDSQLTELVKAGEQNSDEAIEIKNTIQALRELESNLINELLQEQRIEWDPDTALPILESVERAFDFPTYGQGAQQERTIFRGYRNRYDPGTYGAGPTRERARAADSGVDEEVANYYGAQR